MRRAREKQQYLRIQAWTLTESQPEVALALLDEYFALGAHFDMAQAFVDRAKACLSLDQVDDAIRSYQAALARESEYASLKTQAYIELPYLIATRSIERLFPVALKLLWDHRQRLIFTVDHFRWQAAMAFLAAGTDPGTAQTRAKLALEIASREHSGFRYHPTVGLVGPEHDGVLRSLSALAG
ncbi:MAG: hypothetical protein U0Q16_28925 [Bryobacteraceae bacterium]